MGGGALRRWLAFLLLIGAWWTTPAHAAGPAPIVVIVLENHSFGAGDPGVFRSTTKYIVGNTIDAPYINNTLIPQGTLFTNYDAPAIDSLPNYLDMVTGVDAGCGNTCLPDSIPAANLFDLLGKAGIPFDSFLEAMPRNCAVTSAIPYSLHHNPEPYLSNVDANSGLAYGCPWTDVPAPASWPNPLPAFSYVVPSLCNDMHGSLTGGCPGGTDQIVMDGDAWLAANVPMFLSEGAIVIVTFDEGAGGDTTGGGGHVATVMAGPGVGAGASDPAGYSHFSLLAGLEGYFGLTPLLGAAAQALPLPIPPTSPLPPAPTIVDIAPTSGAPGDAVTITGTNLLAVHSVAFNGASASFSIVDDSTLVATVPREATTGPISASSTGGTATSVFDFTVVVQPPAPLVLAQHVAASGKSVQPNAAWPAPTASGDLLVATIGWAGGTLTPPAGWKLAVAQSGTAIYYREGAPSGSGSVAFSLSSSASWVMGLSEWSGVAASGSLDRTAHNTSKTVLGTTADSGTTLPTAQGSEVALASLRALAAVTQSGPTNGFTPLDAGAQGTGNSMASYFSVLTVAGPQDVSATLSASAKWRGVMATFRGA